MEAHTQVSNDSREDEDYISNLHISVLSIILSHLPFKEAVRTSILSKDWQLKWTSLRVVNIDDTAKKLRNELTDANFMNFVNKLLLYSSSVTSFSIETLSICSANLLITWISTVLKSKVERFEYTMKAPLHYGSPSIEFPLSLINNNACLHILKLDFACSLEIFDTQNHFPYLTGLYLSQVQFLNHNSNTDKLSLTFPMLEKLETHHCTWVNVMSVEIYCPSLTTFSTFNNMAGDNGVKNYSIMIIGHKITEIKTGGHTIENILLDGSQLLVSAKFCNHGSIKDVVNIGRHVEDILNRSSSSLEKLKLSDFMVMALRSQRRPLQQYSKLTRLILSCPSNAELLFEILHAAPTLKYLSIKTISWNHYDYDAMESVPSCIASHLEEVKVYNHENSTSQIELIKFMLKNGRALQKLNFHIGLNQPFQKEIIEQVKLRGRKTGLTLSFQGPYKTIVVSDFDTKL